MTTHVHTTAQFGRLVAAVFEEAAHHGKNPGEVSRLAVQAVAHLLERARWSPHGSLLRVTSRTGASILLGRERR
ncbi:MAG: hypothetical protein JW940_07630 [Polyangiaceae bacterium]|nr:hypothetical protein [Polyangiaceae bacterium]